jgi:threonine dehydrogenase-like Zn-dependent dehydrogenase
MKAAVLAEPGRFEIADAPLPEPAPGQVRVRLEGCGVCASNLPPWEGREWFTYPMPPGGLGHEGWGVVDAVGDGVTNWRPGDRVASLSQRAYAEYDVAGENELIRLPAALDGTPFPGEPLGCAINIFDRSHIEAGQTVAVVGVGFLGALLIRLAKNAGARVLAVARRPFAQSVAARMGADEVIPMDDHYRVIERVRALTDDRFCPVVIEAVGKEWPLNLAGELTGTRGRLVVAGYHQDGLRSVNFQLWGWRGLDVINAHERDPSTYLRGTERAVQAAADGALDPTLLFTHTLPLEHIGEALTLTAERPDGFLKALVRIAA